jgi:hypothetical protein
MQMKMRTMVLGLIAMSATGAFAQGNYQKGYVVTLAGDTIRGFIDEKEWSNSPTEISFKPSKDLELPRIYKAAELRYFDLDGKVAYQQYRGPISIDINSIKQTDNPEVISRHVEDTIFLKIIARGKFATLYQHVDRVKIRYFLSTPASSQPEELIYRYYPDGENHIYTDNRYQSQLLFAARFAGPVSKDLSYSIKKSSYGASALIKIVDAINGETKDESRTRSSVHFFVGGGLNIGYQSFHEDKGWNIVSAPSYGPFINVGFDLYANPDVGKLIIRGEAYFSVSRVTLHADSLNGVSTIDYTSPIISGGLIVQPQYYFIRHENLRAYAGLGLGINSSTFNSYNYQLQGDKIATLPNDFNYFALSYYGNFQGGIILNKRYELMISYYPQITSSASVLAPWTTFFNYTKIGFNYHFINTRKRK